MSSNPKPQVTQTSSTPTLPKDDPTLQAVADKLSTLALYSVPDQLPGYTPLVSGERQKPSSYTVPWSERENQLYNEAMSQMATPDTRGEDAAREYYTKEISGENLDPSKNVGLQQQIKALGDDYNANIQRNVGETLARAGKAGAGGGARSSLLQGQAIGEGSRGLAAATGELLGKSYAGNRMLQAQAAQPLQQMDKLPLQRKLQQLELAGAPRAAEQAERNAQIQELENERAAQYQPLQVAQSLLGQRMGQSIPIVSPTSNPMSGAASLMSGAGNLASGLSSAFGGGSKTTSGGGGGGNEGASIASGVTSMLASIWAMY